MTNTGIANYIEKDQPKADMKAADLKSFNLDDLETHEDAFRKLLSQTTSVTKKCSFLRRWLQSHLQMTLKSACFKCH